MKLKVTKIEDSKDKDLKAQWLNLRQFRSKTTGYRPTDLRLYNAFGPWYEGCEVLSQRRIDVINERVKATGRMPKCATKRTRLQWIAVT